MYNMLDKILMIFIIFISVIVHDPAYGEALCQVRDDFKISKMVGTWNYIGGINPDRIKIRCGQLSLKRVSKHRLMGHATGFLHEEFHKISVQAYVNSGIFSLRYIYHNSISEDIMLKIKTCNNINEFSLESPNDKKYFIFARDFTVTPIYLRHYRALGDEIGSKLRLGNHTDCDYL